MEAIVCSLDKQQMLEIAGELLLLAEDRTDSKAFVLKLAQDQALVFCTPENFSKVCEELSQESTEEANHE